MLKQTPYEGPCSHTPYSFYNFKTPNGVMRARPNFYSTWWARLGPASDPPRFPTQFLQYLAGPPPSPPRARPIFYSTWWFCLSPASVPPRSQFASRHNFYSTWRSRLRTRLGPAPFFTVLGGLGPASVPPRSRLASRRHVHSTCCFAAQHSIG